MRPSAMIAIGLVVGQGAVYLATPLLSRIYSPEQIGTAAAVLAAGGVIGAVGTARLELLLSSAEDEEVRWLTRRASMLMIVMATALSPVAGLILGFSMLDTVFTALTAIGISSVGLSLQIASRLRELRGIAAAKAVQGVGQTAVQIALGVPAPSVGMQTGAAFGLLAAGGVQALSARRGLRALPAAKLKPGRGRQIVRSALMLTAAAAGNATVVAALPMLTQGFFGAETTGQLAVAQRLALAPAGLAVAAVLPVVIAQFGAAARADLGASRAVVIRWLRRLLPLGLVATAALLAAPLVPLSALLGPEWDGVGLYVAAMAPQIGAQLVAGPLSQCLVIQRRERTQLVWDMVRLAAVFGVAALVVLVGGDAVAMVSAVSIVLVLGYAVHVWLVIGTPRSHSV
ncbi:hypothetical protein [Microbacterium stercoris]|uniref:Polysaccharide biosynthesis protein n=1 Tax=Microbacterium stercoris TaxID=2820289 RepID=A0A939QIH3_9MICO|nr:hypothetical protein [Microbacterium stercoris]MBO3663532.1 hypothetical protein [Microbacterium stercoris]